MRRHEFFPRLGIILVLIAGIVTSATLSAPWLAAQEEPPIVGDYAVTIGPGDIPEELPNGAALIGRWHVAFLADGSYFAERLDVGRVIEGVYEVDGESLTVTDTGGIISCATVASQTVDQGDVAVGEYAFTVDESLLTLTPTADPCESRRVLFGTRDFGEFIACLTGAAEGSPVASPVAQATPVDETATEDEATDDDLLDLLTPATTDEDGPVIGPGGDGQDDESDGAGSGNVDEEIDALLAQMTACWQTQDPEKFLPLLTESFQDQFLGGGDVEEQTSQLEQLMVVPLTWERAGDIEEDGRNRVRVVVRLAVAGEEQFGTYLFLRENGVWKWDGQEL